ncbi:cyclophilin-like fold protein [Streptomyces sp. NPDC001732]
MNLHLTTETGSFAATLNDSAAARDLVTLLPLTLETEDFHQSERIAYPPRKLDTSGAPNASHPKAGDLAYYTPWGNLALFYRDGQRSPSLDVLGQLTDRKDAQQLATADRITIENLPRTGSGPRSPSRHAKGASRARCRSAAPRCRQRRLRAFWRWPSNRRSDPSRCGSGPGHECRPGPDARLTSPEGRLGPSRSSAPSQPRVHTGPVSCRASTGRGRTVAGSQPL